MFHSCRIQHVKKEPMKIIVDYVHGGLGTRGRQRVFEYDTSRRVMEEVFLLIEYFDMTVL